MRGEQSRAAALFDVGDKNDDTDDDDVFVGGGGGGVGACANMYGRKPVVVLFLVKQSKDTSSSKRSLSFSLLCVLFRVLKM